MLRKFLLLLLITTISISTAWAQIPESIAPLRFEAAPRTPLGCAEGSAGGTIRTLGANNKNKADVRYLCLGDSLFLNPNGTADISNDSFPATPAGIGYFFYSCKPTVTGPRVVDFKTDPCIFKPTGEPTVSRGIPSGRDTFFNNGILQQLYGNRLPIKFYFAPINMTQFYPTATSAVGFDGNFNCINVNVNDRMTPTDTFSVVYLNAVNVKVTTLTSTGGTFVVSGGLPEYDGTSNYTYTIRLATDPLVVGTVTSGANASNGGTVTFSVPREGTYIIKATDGKSCDGQAPARFPNMTIQVSDNIVRQGDTSCVTVSAKNFKNIVSIQCAFQFDPTIVQFVGVRNVNANLPRLDPNSFNNPSNSNAITFSWSSSSGSGSTLADNESLFEMCFKAIGPIGSVSPIRISDTLVNLIEVADSVFDPVLGNRILGVSLKNGSITIGNLDFTIKTRADSARCFGLTGGFRVNITGGGAPFTYNWQSATNPGQNGTGTIATVNDTAIVINRPAGKYYVTVTNAANIQKIDSVEVRQPPALFLNAPTTVNPTCTNDSDGSLTLTGYGGGTPSYSFIWSTGATTAAITGLAAGAYGVTMTDAKGCQESIPRITMGVNPIVIVNSQVREATCKGVNTGSITISAVQGGTTIGGSYTFRWSFNNTTNVGANSTLSNLPPGLYYVTITDRNLCRKVDSFQVDALRIVESSAVIGNIACFGETNGFINATASTRGPEAQPYTFTWAGLVGTPTNTATTTFVRSLAAGMYSLTITDRDQCRFDTTFTIKSPDSIKLALATLTNETCAGNGTSSANGAITVAASGGTAPYTYLWSRGAADTNPSITGLRAGTYTLTVRDSANCVKTRDYTITAPVFPIIDSFRLRNATCSDRNDGSARVFYRAGTGTRIQSVRWSNSGFLDSISPVLAGNYIVTVTADNGCVRTDTAKITAPTRIKVDTARTAKFDPTCPKQATGRAIIIVQGGTTPYSYNWSGGATQSGAVFAALSAGTYTFTITDANGCTPDSATITLIDPPTVQVAFTDIEGTSCYGTCDGKAKITARGGSANTGVYSFNWSSGEITNNAASSKAVQLCGGWQFVTVSDAVCPYPRDSVFIQRPDSFSFITPPIISPSCKGDRDGSAEIRPRGGTLPYSYLWSNGSTRNTIVNVAAGKYTVTITDAQFCPFTLSLNIDEPDSLKIDTIPFRSKNVSCFGLADGLIKIGRTGGNGATTQTTYEWTPSVSQSDSAKGLKSGAYTIIGRDLKGCRDSITINLTQPDPIFFYMPPLTQPRCNGELTTLRIDTAFGSTYKYPFSVSVDNGPQYPIGYFIPVFAGRHEINIIEQVSGCTLDTAVTISEPPPLSIRFDTISSQNLIAKKLVGLGDSIRINPLITSALPIDSVSWTPRTYLSFRSDPLRPYTRPLDDITYKLTIVDVNGCSTSEQLFIELDRNRNVFIPNIFSPNGDDKNDYFGVFNGVGVKMINYVRIFDRWGEMMFTKNKILPYTDVTQGWDGTFRGKVVENGVYIYLIEVEFEDGQKLLYRGDVTVTR